MTSRCISAQRTAIDLPPQNLPLINPATGDILSVPFVKADTLWSYEVGAKGNLADGVFGYDVAVYLIKWEDLQVFRSFMGVNVGGNADSDVTANGLEATLTYQPTNAFNLAATLAYAQSELDEDDPALGGLEGEQLPGIPEWTFSLSGNYDFMLGDRSMGSSAAASRTRMSATRRSKAASVTAAW